MDQEVFETYKYAEVAHPTWTHVRWILAQQNQPRKIRSAYKKLGGI